MTTNPTTPPEPQAGATPRTGLTTDGEIIRDFQPPDEVYAAAKLLANYFAREGFSSSWSFMGISCRDRADKLETALATSRAETEAARARADKWESHMYAARHKARVALHFPRGHVCDFRNACQSFMDLSASLEPMEQRLATLTATLAQREGELEHWKNEMNQLPALVKARTERDTALARVRELECDGRRLDWLEANNRYAIGFPSDKSHKWFIFFDDSEVSADNLRAAIDKAAAARAAGTGEEGAGV